MGTELRDAELTVAMAAVRVFAGVISRSMESVESLVSVSQLRVLVVMSREPNLNVGSLARVLSVHASNATRTCDRLVDLGLVEREQSAEDRRQVHLRLTVAGRATVETVLRAREREMSRLLGSMSAAERLRVLTGLRELVERAGEPPVIPADGPAPDL